MSEEKNILTRIIEFIISIFKYDNNQDVVDTTKEIEEINRSSGSLKNKLKDSGDAIIESMSESAIDESVAQATKLISKHGDYLLGLSEVQREYAIKIAFLKSVNDLGKLSIDELIEYRNYASKAMELGIDVADEMNSFWNDFGDAAKSVINTASNIGATAAATALKVLVL